MLQGATKLNKSEMKSVTGGDYRTGSCAFKNKNGYVMRGVSKQMALDMMGEGGRWCCDSCGSASWLN